MTKFRYFVFIFLLIFVFGEYAFGQRGRRAFVNKVSERALERTSERQVSSLLPLRRANSVRSLEDFSVSKEVSQNLINDEVNATRRNPEEIATILRGQASSGSLVALRYQRKLFDNPEYDIIDAIHENEPEIVQLLVNNGADPNTTRKNEDGEIFYSALMKAVLDDNFNIVDILLNAGADVNLKNMNGFTALYFVQSTYLASLLVDHSADVHVRFNDESTLLHIVRDIGALQVFIEKDIDVHARDILDLTPLHTVENADKARFLINNGADVHSQTRIGWTPLHTASVAGRVGVVRVLIEKGAKVNAEDVRGWTPLDEADAGIRLGIDTEETIQVLLEKGGKRGDNKRPMPIMCSGGSCEIVRNDGGIRDNFSRWIGSFFH